MYNQSTPKTAAFLSLVQKTGTLHAEISTLDAATEYVGIAAGGADALKTFPFARRVLAEMERHRVMPSATESTTPRLPRIGMAVD